MLTPKQEIRPPGDELDAVGRVSIDPIGGPQGPYFSTEFEKIDTDNDGLITWKQLCEANPHVWVEEERRVHYLEMFDSLTLVRARGRSGLCMRSGTRPGD